MLKINEKKNKTHKINPFRKDPLPEKYNKHVIAHWKRIHRHNHRYLFLHLWKGAKDSKPQKAFPSSSPSSLCILLFLTDPKGDNNCIFRLDIFLLILIDAFSSIFLWHKRKKTYDDFCFIIRRYQLIFAIIKKAVQALTAMEREVFLGK